MGEGFSSLTLTNFTFSIHASDNTVNSTIPISLTPETTKNTIQILTPTGAFSTSNFTNNKMMILGTSGSIPVTSPDAKKQKGYTESLVDEPAEASSMRWSSAFCNRRGSYPWGCHPSMHTPTFPAPARWKTTSLFSKVAAPTLEMNTNKANNRISM